MLCFRYRRLLIPYSEGLLDARAAAKVEGHLVKCTRCRTELDGIRMVAGVLGGSDMPSAEPADDLWARVSAGIASESPASLPGRALGLMRGFAAGGAAAVVVGVLAVRLLTPSAVPVARGGIDVAQKSVQQPTKQAQPVEQQPKQKVVAPKPVEPKSEPKPPALHERRYFAKATAPVSVGYPVHKVKVERVALALPKATEAGEKSPKVPAAMLRRKQVESACRYMAPAAGLPATVASAPDTSPTLADEPRVLLGVRPERADVRAAVANADTTAAPTTSIVDDLNETEGVRTAAIFSYP